MAGIEYNKEQNKKNAVVTPAVEDKGSSSASARDEKPLVTFEGFSDFIDETRKQLKKIVSIAPKSYHEFGQVEGAVSDLSTLLDQSHDEWAQEAPLVIHTLIRWMLSPTLIDLMTPRVIGGDLNKYLMRLASGTVADTSHFTAALQKTHQSAEYIAKRVRVKQAKATMYAQIILNCQQEGKCVLPYIWHLSTRNHVRKNGQR